MKTWRPRKFFRNGHATATWIPGCQISLWKVQSVFSWLNSYWTPSPIKPSDFYVFFPLFKGCSLVVPRSMLDGRRPFPLLHLKGILHGAPDHRRSICEVRICNWPKRIDKLTGLIMVGTSDSGSWNGHWYTKCIPHWPQFVYYPHLTGAFYLGNGWVAGGCWDDYW